MRKKVQIKYDENGETIMKCIKCGEWLTTDHYHTNERNSYGYFSICKECVKKRVEDDPIHSNKIVQEGSKMVLKNLEYDLERNIEDQFNERLLEFIKTRIEQTNKEIDYVSEEIENKSIKYLKMDSTDDNIQIQKVMVQSDLKVLDGLRLQLKRLEDYYERILN